MSETWFLGPVIGNGAHSVVYASTVRGREAALKVAIDASKEATRRLRWEAASLAIVSHEGVAAVWETGRLPDGRALLVEERVEGEQLAETIRLGPHREEWVVALGCRLAETLHHIHGCGLVHRDLNPTNILLPSDGTPRPRIVDFGLAIARERFADATLGGTLAYSAPEQTGSLRRPVDGRADLYALGAVLFECLSGQPPFEAETAAIMVRKHLQEPPPDLCSLRPEISPALAKIVARLLAKDPDDRYATAALLHADLSRVGPAEIPPLLARGPEHLVGVDSELALAISLLTEATKQRGSTVLVRSPPGGGTTSFARTIVETAGRRGTRSLWAASDGSSAVPFGVFVRLIADLLGPQWTTAAEDPGAAVRRAAAGLEPFLVATFPALSEHLTGSGAPPEAGQERYFEAISRFLVNLIDGLGGGVIVIDGVQHLDDESFGVLQQLIAHAPQGRVFVLLTQSGTIAANRILRTEPLIELDPLEESGVAELARRILGPLHIPASLVQNLYQRSLGNPLSAREALDAILHAGLLTPHWDEWSFDEGGLLTLNLPTGLSDLMLRRVGMLTQESQACLRIAALCGDGVTLGTLKALTDGTVSPQVLERALQAGMFAGLLTCTEGGHYRFIHRILADRLMADLTEADQRRLAARLATLEDAAGATDDASLYTRARHHQLGLSADTAQAAVTAVMAAGERALERRAASRALELLRWAQQTAEQHHIETGYRLFTKLAEACREMSDAQEALHWLQRALAACGDTTQRVVLHLMAAELNALVLTDVRATAAEIDQLYALAGARRPRNDLWTLLTALWWMLATMFFEFTRWRLKPPKDRVTTVAVIRAGEPGAVQALFDNEMFHALYLAGRNPYLSLALGPSFELAECYAGRSVAMAVFGLPARFREYYLDKAVKMGAEIGDPYSVARSRVRGGVGCGFAGDLVQAGERLERVLAESDSYLNFTDLLFAVMELANGLTRRGYTERARKVLEKYAQELITKRSTDRRWDNVRPTLMVCYAVIGRRADAAQLVAGYRSHARTPEAGAEWIQRWGAQIALRLETQDFHDRELDFAIEQLQRTKMQMSLLTWHLVGIFIDAAWVRYNQFVHTQGEPRRERLAQLRVMLRQLGKARPHPLSSLHLEILSAGLQASSGDSQAALVRLARAESAAKRADFPLCVYLARLLRARIWMQRGHRAAAQVDASAAAQLALDKEWPTRVAAVVKEFALDKPRQEAPRSASTTLASHMTVERHGGLRGTNTASALLTMSVAISSSNDAATQARAAVDTLLEVLVGERGLLFFVGSDGSLEQAAARHHQKRDLAEDLDFARQLSEHVLRTRAPLVLGAERSLPELQGAALPTEIRSLICAPLTLQSEVFGVVYLDSRLAKGVFRPEDMDMLLAISTQIALARQSALRAQQELDRRGLEKELELSAAVQRLLLPAARDPAAPGHVEWSAHYQPASRAGGDFWSRTVLRNATHRFVVGDVTGHGAGPALITAIVSGCLRTINSRRNVSGEALIAQLDRVVHRLCGGEYTIALTLFDLGVDGHAQYWTCAAPPLLHLNASGIVSAHGVAGSPVGDGSGTPHGGSFPVTEGDFVLLTTDGLLELAGRHGRPLGLRALSRGLRACQALTPEHARDELVRLAKAHAAADPDDDVTFVVLQRSRSAPERGFSTDLATTA